MIRKVGFVDVSVRVRAVQSMHHEKCEALLDRLTSVIHAIAGAGALADDDTDVAPPEFHRTP